MPATGTTGQVPNGEIAQVVTATVELVIVRIGRKQMTKAVYNQLPPNYVINGEGEIRGNVWGLVRMAPEECQRDQKFNQRMGHEPHSHILWESGGVLYRSCLVSDPDASSEGRDAFNRAHDEHDKALRAFLDACLVEGYDPIAAGELEIISNGTQIYPKGKGSWSVGLGEDVRHVLRGQTRDLGGFGDYNLTPEEREVKRQARAEEVRQAARGRLQETGATLQSSRDAMRGIRESEQARRAKYKESYETCLNAGQLYIAV